MTVPAIAATSTNTSLSPGAQSFNEVRLAPDTLAMSWRSLITMMRSPGEFYDILTQPVMLTVLFGELFDDVTADGVKAHPPTIVPGLIIVNALTTSQSVGVGLREDVDKGILGRFRVMPMFRTVPTLGPMVSDVLYYLIYTSLTVLIGYVLGYRSINDWSETIGIIILAAGYAWTIAWIFLFLGTVFPPAQAVAFFTVIVLFLLTFLSSTMVSISTLPGWLKAFVRHNPVSHIVDGGRYLLDEAVGSARDVWTVVIGSLLILAIMAPLTVVCYQRRSA